MKQAKAKLIRHEINKEAEKRGVEYKKLFNRRAKRKYNQIPRPQRENFSIKQLP